MANTNERKTGPSEVEQVRDGREIVDGAKDIENKRPKKEITEKDLDRGEELYTGFGFGNIVEPRKIKQAKHSTSTKYSDDESVDNPIIKKEGGLPLESDDTLAVLSYIVPQYKDKYEDAKSILWGESYGGLTSIIAAGREDYYIDYLILDSSISDGRILLKEVMEDATKDQDIPMSYLMAAGDWYSRFALGVKFSDFDGLKWIKNVTKPVLITNSNNDTLTPPYMAEDLYKAISHDKKELKLVDGYKHASFPKDDNSKYMEIVKDFLEKYELNNEDTDESTE